MGAFYTLPMIRPLSHRRLRPIQRLALVAFLGLGLAGCKKSAPMSSEYVCSDADHEGYIRQSAEWGPEEGEGVVVTTSAKPIVTGYFGKKYNQDWLTAVGRSSILETIDFINTTGARVYRADPISPKSTMNLSAAAVMPWDLERVWRDADQPIAGNSCAFMAGLYLGEKTRGLLNLRNHSAIIVREDAGRWTLVHEFMHHNFKTEAAALGYNDEAERVRANALFKQIADLKKDHSISNREYAVRLSDYFQALIDVVDQLVIQYQFEEVTVEATLQDKYRIGELAYVPAGSYANASWYIEHSKRSIQNLYDNLTSTYNELSLLTSTNGLFRERTALDRYTAMREYRLGQLDAFIAKRKATARLGLVASTEVMPAGGYAPCARAQAMEDQMTAISDALRTPRAGN